MSVWFQYIFVLPAAARGGAWAWARPCGRLSRNILNFIRAVGRFFWATEARTYHLSGLTWAKHFTILCPSQGVTQQSPPQVQHTGLALPEDETSNLLGGHSPPHMSSRPAASQITYLILDFRFKSSNMKGRRPTGNTGSGWANAAPESYCRSFVFGQRWDSPHTTFWAC